MPVEQRPCAYVAAVHQLWRGDERAQAEPVVGVIRPRLDQVARVDVRDIVGDEVKVGRRYGVGSQVVRVRHPGGLLITPAVRTLSVHFDSVLFDEPTRRVRGPMTLDLDFGHPDSCGDRE